jgi:hypothetical protein
MKPTAFFAAGFVLLSACEADNNARNLSRVTLTQVIAYEEAERAAGRTLNSYYQQQTDSIATTLTTLAEVGGRVDTTSNAEAVGEQAYEKGRLTPPMIRDFVASSTEQDRQTQVTFTEAITAMRKAQSQGRAAASVEEDRLKDVRSYLEKLQAEPGLTSYLDRMKPLYDAVKEGIPETPAP